MDGTPFLNNSLTYQHWGYFMPQNIKEPNNLVPPELCVGANYTEAYKNAWAWADTNCGDPYPYMCMNAREPPAWQCPMQWSGSTCSSSGQGHEQHWHALCSPHPHPHPLRSVNPLDLISASLSCLSDASQPADGLPASQPAQHI